jgi:hypothetical protein
MRIFLVLWLAFWLIVETKIGIVILPLTLFGVIALTEAKKEKESKR